MESGQYARLPIYVPKLHREPQRCTFGLDTGPRQIEQILPRDPRDAETAVVLDESEPIGYEAREGLANRRRARSALESANVPPAVTAPSTMSPRSCSTAAKLVRLLMLGLVKAISIGVMSMIRFPITISTDKSAFVNIMDTSRACEQPRPSTVMPGCGSDTRQRRAPLQQRVSQHVATDGEAADRSLVRVAKNHVRVFNERSNLSIDALTTCTR